MNFLKFDKHYLNCKVTLHERAHRLIVVLINFFLQLSNTAVTLYAYMYDVGRPTV